MGDRSVQIDLLHIEASADTGDGRLPLLVPHPRSQCHRPSPAARWNMDTYSPEAERISHEIETEGVLVLRAQPGFVRYRLMRENKTTTFAVADGSLRHSVSAAPRSIAAGCDAGIMDHITLETHTGQIVASSR
jgi:hypothetical protein